MKKQVWRPVAGYEELYSISNDGLVRSNHKRNNGGLLQPRIDRGGYLSLRLHKEGKAQTKFLHRILAQAFIPNPHNKKYVNHRNGDKLNNCLKNLEWTTHTENVIHAYQHGLNSFAKNIVDSVTGYTYPSIKDAAKAIQMNYNTCCKRLEKQDATFRLRYSR